MLSIGDDPHPTTPAPHGGDQRPLVGLRVVALSGQQALIPIETTTDEHLGRIKVEVNDL